MPIIVYFTDKSMFHKDYFGKLGGAFIYLFNFLFAFLYSAHPDSTSIVFIKISRDQAHVFISQRKIYKAAKKYTFCKMEGEGNQQKLGQ